MPDSSNADTPLSVGVNLMFMGERAGGLGRYARNLLASLARVEPGIRVSAIIGSEAPADMLSEPWATQIKWLRIPISPRNVFLHRLAHRFITPIMARHRHLDVFHNPATFGPRRIPGIPVVTSLLELIAAEYPQTQWANDKVAAHMSYAVRRAARSADRVLTASTAAAEELARSLNVDPRRIDSVPLGIAPPTCRPTPEADLRVRHGLDDRRIVLCVAQKLPHKNLEVLVQSLPELQDQRVVLVLPGAHTRYEGELMALASSLGVRDSVRTPDWLSESDLEGMYAAADCLVLPSLMEGFGLPVLEGMIRGVPVACSNRWALPEVAGDAALLFEPTDTAAVTDAIRKLLTSSALRKEMIDRGRSRAAQFTWERCAHETANCYRKAAGKSRNSGT